MNTIKVMKKSRIINIFLLILKFIFGLFGNSFALITDAFDSFIESLQDTMCILAMNYSKKENTLNHPFGKGKIEILSGIMLGLIMIVFSTFFIYEAVLKIIFNQFNNLQLFVIIPAIINIIAKIYQYKIKINTNDQLAMDSAAENKLDMLNSVLIIGATIIYFIANQLGSDKFNRIDLFVALIISLIYLITGLKIMIKNISRNLDARIDQKTTDLLIKIVENVPDVIHVEDLIAEDYGSYIVIYADVQVDDQMSVKDSHDVTGKIRKALHQNNFIQVRDVIIHIEPYYHINSIIKKEN
jgi:cation diffusion facilitator family transporter